MAAFRYREYRFFWLAAAFSNIGMWALIYGRLWLMHDITDSLLMVGLVTTSSLGPVLLFSMWGGVVADRVNRLRLVMSTRAMFAVLALLTGGLLASDIILPWHIIAISVGTGVLLAFDIPSRSAMLPALVPRQHLASAITLYSLVFGGAAIVGPALFAPFVSLWGMEGVFFLIGATYVLTVGALAFMKHGGHKPEVRSRTMLQGLTDGFRYIWRHQVIKGVIVLGLVVGVFSASLETFLPMLSDKVITGGINTYSRLLFYAGVGGLVAPVSIILLGTRVRPARVFVVSGICLGVGLLILSRASWFPIAALSIGLIGAFRSVFGIMGTTLVLSMAADEFRGRVMSIQMFTWGAAALGGLLMGALGEGVGMTVALGFGGLVIAAATAVVALSSLRRLVTASSEATSSSIPSEHPD